MPLLNHTTTIPPGGVMTESTNMPKLETGVDPLTEDELKEGEPAIRLALEIAEWMRGLPPEEQRQMLADFEQHMAECPPSWQPASEALRRYLVRACFALTEGAQP